MHAHEGAAGDPNHTVLIDQWMECVLRQPLHLVPLCKPSWDEPSHGGSSEGSQRWGSWLRRHRDHSLGMIHQEVFDPRADIVRQKQIAQFVFRRKMLGSGGLCGLLRSLTSAPALHPRLLLLSKRRFCLPFPGMIIHEAPGFMTKSAVRL